MADIYKLKMSDFLTEWPNESEPTGAPGREGDVVQGRDGRTWVYHDDGGWWLCMDDQCGCTQASRCLWHERRIMEIDAKYRMVGTVHG